MNTADLGMNSSQICLDRFSHNQNQVKLMYFVPFIVIFRVFDTSVILKKKA